MSASTTSLSWRDRASVSQDEAAEITGLSRQTIWVMRRRGELRSVCVGRRVLIPVSEIRRLIGDAE